MTTIGLIVEGIYDETVLPELVRRCRSGVRTVTRKCKGPVIGKFPGLVAELDRSYPRIEKVLVISDADGRNPAEMERDFKARLVKSYRFKVVPIIIAGRGSKEFLQLSLRVSYSLRTTENCSHTNDIFQRERIGNEPRFERFRLHPATRPSNGGRV